MLRVKQHLLSPLLLLLVVATLHVQGIDEFDFYKTEDAIQGLQSIAAGPKGVWAVASDGSVHYRVGSYTGRWVIRFGNSWKTISGPAMKQLDVGSSTVWAVSEDGKTIYNRGVIASYLPEGRSWSPFRGPSGSTVCDLSVGPHNSLWIVDCQGKVYKYVVGSASFDKWKEIPGVSLVSISVGFGGVWGVDSAGNVYYRTGTRRQLGEEGTGWEQVSGAPMKQVLTGALREVFGIDDQGVVHVRQGSDPDNLAGTHWLEAPAEFQGLKALDVFYYYAVGLKRDSNDAIFIHWY